MITLKQFIAGLDAVPGTTSWYLADISEARKLIGFEPVILFQEGLEKSIDWYRRNLG